MKKFSKILSVALLVALVLSLGVANAFAAGTRTITITPPTGTASDVTNTYNIYKVFDAVAGEDGSISYTLMAGKTAPVMKDENSLSKFDVDAAGNVQYYTRASVDADWVVKTTAGGSLTSDDIAALTAYVAKDDASYTATSTGTNNAVANNVEDGYYFITTSTGSAVTVDSTTPNAEVIDKNSVPGIDKTVQEDSIVAATAGAADGDGVNGYQKQNDVEIGQKVYFKTVVNAKKNGVGYVVYDKMDSALTLDQNSIKVYRGSVAEANLVTAGENTYSVAFSGTYMKGSSAGTAIEDGNATFVLTFAQAYLDGITQDTNLIILYEATLNSNAVVATPALNDTTLKYGNETSNFSDEKETRTYSWGINVIKQDGTDTTKKLAGAKFVIFKAGATEGTVQIAKFDANGKFTAWSDAITKTDAQLLAMEEKDFDATSILTTAETTGEIKVSGLDEGTYKLLEVVAPTGYNKMTTIETAVIDSTSDGETAKTLENAITAETNGFKVVPINNNKGAQLPSTGGIGTTIFYVVGGVLVLAAIILLVTKKRMSE